MDVQERDSLNLSYLNMYSNLLEVTRNVIFMILEKMQEVKYISNFALL